MNVFITGGTGFLGRALTDRLLAEGHAVTILSRGQPQRQQYTPTLSYVLGDPAHPGHWQEALADHEVVINLAGASIFRRWSEESKKVLRESRIATTRNLVAGLAARKGQPTTLITGSAVGYYGFHRDEEIDENGAGGSDFLATLCRDWEAAAMEAEPLGVRVIPCRIGVIIGPDGGALSRMLTAFRFGLGSPLGKGSQWFSWIHLDDLVNAFLFLIRNQSLTGPVNCTAPQPVTNREMSRALARALNRPLMPAAPAFLVRLALGEFGSVLLEGQRVVPKKLQDHGFSFRYPAIAGAFRQVVRGAAPAPVPDLASR
ncbi:MAG: TIGR01777 family oxidoreductase [Desulfobulbaceae bacterium]|nr:TIGR01777 family oxidoreductase [Desulfobulbaceae bacterium]